MTLLHAVDAVLAEEERRSGERAEAVRRAIERTRLIAVAAGPAAVLGALLLAALLMGRVVRALVELKNVGLAWRAGRLEVRLPQRVQDELGDVSRTLNDMAAALRRHEEALEETRAHLDRILDALPDALVVTDAQGRIQRVNGALERLLGHRAAELRRRPVETLLPGAAEAPWAEAVRRGEPVREAAARCLRADGRSLPVRLSVTPLRSPDGGVQGRVYLLHAEEGGAASSFGEPGR